MTNYILFFDGVCNLCHYGVRFILRWDRQELIKFCPIDLAPYRNFNDPRLRSLGNDTVVLYNLSTHKLSKKSDAALELLKIIGSPWSFLRIGIIIPRRWRDRIYDILARNRYKWFGKTDVCHFNNTSEQKRFF